MQLYPGEGSTDNQPARGVVEVCLGGELGTMCDDGFEDQGASVVCKQLGFSPYGELLHIKHTWTCNGWA